jgi:hypothetical protein
LARRGVTIRLQGFRELERALAEDLPKATAKNALNRTAVNSMERVRVKMAQLAPHDPQDRDQDGNHLNETMKTQRVKAKRQRGSVRFKRSSGVEVMTGPAPVGKRARSNAGWQEDGTVKMGPNAYVRPAADTEGRAVVAEIRDELAKQIEKAKARIAKKLARKG